jgi:S-adenosylmethionine:tRNA ribosyltransferase-isomerase
MKTSELDYHLPPELIAQHPCERRDASRLLVIDRASRTLRVDVFRNIAAHLRAGDCMVVNDTQVIRARLHATKPTGGRIEVFLLRERAPGTWTALVRPSARVKPGTRIRIADTVDATIGKILSEGIREVRFERPDVLRVLEQVGEIPLPPYIVRAQPEDADLTRYQTIYARAPGAVAAPTAGLHFTEDTLRALADAGVQRAALTLHVGYGTFRPITAERIEDHTVEPEEFWFPDETAQCLNRTRADGGRIIAVGTTSARVLESRFHDASFHPGAGITDLFVYLSYLFNAVDILLTNFHLPCSSLLALVCAFAGTQFLIEAYQRAVQERFRFYSYGDAMLIL